MREPNRCNCGRVIDEGAEYCSAACRRANESDLHRDGNTARGPLPSVKAEPGLGSEGSQAPGTERAQSPGERVGSAAAMPPGPVEGRPTEPQGRDPKNPGSLRPGPGPAGVPAQGSAVAGPEGVPLQAPTATNPSAFLVVRTIGGHEVRIDATAAAAMYAALEDGLATLIALCAHPAPNGQAWWFCPPVQKSVYQVRNAIALVTGRPVLLPGEAPSQGRPA